MTITEEFEVKFLDINPDEIQEKLKAIGAEKVGEYHYRRRVFDYPDRRLNSRGAWVRVRDEGERVTLTYKQRLGIKSLDATAGNDDGMEEVEVVVSDFDATCAIFEKIGLVEKHFLENRRVRWKKEDVEFDIDFYPLLTPYLEIEAGSRDKVAEAISWLALSPADQKICSGNQVFKWKGIDLDEYRRLTFTEAIKHGE